MAPDTEHPAWSALRRRWPEFDWTDAVSRRGAFHQVAILGSTAVVRLLQGTDHAARLTREAAVMEEIGRAGLALRVPRLLATATSASWSALACTVVPGSHRVDPAWPEVREGLLFCLEQLRAADITRLRLPAARSWCGGESWPAIVDQLTAIWATRPREAARRIVQDVVELGPAATTSLVHGDFGAHNLLWDETGTPGLVDLDHACAGDPAIDLAPLVGAFGAGPVAAITDSDTLERALIHRASLPLQVAAAAFLGNDKELRDHALGNFLRRFEDGSLYDPAAT